MIPSTTTNTSQVSQATGTGSPIVLSLNPSPSAGTIRPPSVRILAGRLRSAPYTHSFPIVLDSTDPWVSDSEILDNDQVVLHEPQGEQDPVSSGVRARRGYLHRVLALISRAASRFRRIINLR